jgi:sporulation protein YlmC with PRC-barrel domain
MRGTEQLPVDRSPRGRVLDAQLHLLDRQVLDRDGIPVATVDDVELAPLPGTGAGPGAGPGTGTGPGPHDGGMPTLVITALLTGPVLGTRMAGGRPPESRWLRIPWRLVTDVGTVVRLGTSGSDLDVTWTERWLRDHVIGRIPGGRHDPD